MLLRTFILEELSCGELQKSKQARRDVIACDADDHDLNEEDDTCKTDTRILDGSLSATENDTHSLQKMVIIT